ncbi:MAG: sigma-70 family RNA polymerase sigma factor [Pseudomonadota bacterium]
MSDLGAERQVLAGEVETTDALDASDETVAQTRSAILSLYKARADKITRTLRAMFGDGPPDPEDVTQQAFEKLLARGDCSDIKDPQAFLWRTARNLCLKGRRHEDVRSKYDFEIEQLFFAQQGAETAPERVLRAREELALINEALRRMPELRRQAFVLSRIEGLTVTQVAQRLNISRSPATRHIQRACRDIELYLHEHGGTGDDTE